MTNERNPTTSTALPKIAADTPVHTSLKQAVAPFVSDTVTIDKKAAVFYQPDSLQIEKQMKEVGAKDFRAGADDYIFYVNSSVAYLEQQGLPLIDAKNKKYVKFIMANTNVHLIKLDTLKELWGMYLFDPGKKPYYADMTMIEESYKKYFN